MSFNTTGNMTVIKFSCISLHILCKENTYLRNESGLHLLTCLELNVCTIIR